jgi:phosphodiesterase/alkaline phosphatase D-like protein
MKLVRRDFFHLAASAAALPTVSRIAKAQTYPTRPALIILGVASGGKALRRRILVENPQIQNGFEKAA